MRHARMMFIAGLVLVAAGPAQAQTGTPAEEPAVRRAVETFVNDLERLDYHKVSQAMTTRALIVISRQRDGAFANAYLSRDEWLGSLWGNPNPVRFEEPLSNVRVFVDAGQIAHVRADFQILIDGKPVSSGVDQFTLVRETDGWKIAAVAFTSIPAPLSRQ